MHPDSLANRAVAVLGAGFASFLAFRSFRKRGIRLGDEPTLPEYFTRRSLYWLSAALYCLLVTVLYFLLTTNWLPLQPLVSTVAENVNEGQLADLFKSLDGGKLVPLIVAAVFLFLIWWDNRFNPLLLVRDAIHDAFAMPRKATEVYNALRNSRLADIDEALKKQIAGRLLIASIDPGDFEKSSATVEYKWAHSSVLFDQIQSYANQPSYLRFFSEPSLKWGDICIAYNAMSEQVAVWKQAEPHYTKTMNLIKDLDHVESLLCRLLACLIVFGCGNDKEIWTTVRRLGGDIYEARLKHTYKYVLIFTAAITLGVILGRELSIVFHNSWIYPESKLAHFDDATLRWTAYAILIYLLPIALVFVARSLAFRLGREESERNYGFYTLMMVIGFLVSTSASVLILELTYFRREDFSFLQGFVQHMRWGILPALVCGFVAYRMDTPASESEPLSSLLSGALLRFSAWAAIAMIIMLYATDDMTIGEPQLRFTIVGTTMLGVGFLGAVARFKTISTTQ